MHHALHSWQPDEMIIFYNLQQFSCSVYQFLSHLFKVVLRVIMIKLCQFRHNGPNFKLYRVLFKKYVLLYLMAAEFFRFNAWKYQEELIPVSLSA